MINQAGYPEVLTELSDCLGRALVEAGVTAAIALSVAGDLVEHMRTKWGGRNLYINRRDGLFGGDDEAGEFALLLRDLAGKAMALLLDKGFPEAEAWNVARGVVSRFQQERGTEKIYLPKGRALNTSRRNALIWARYNGQNAGALAREFGLTDRAVQMIASAKREEVIAERNLRLFEV